MKHTFRNLSFLILALLVILSQSVKAFATDATITFKGLAEGFDFQPGSEYTATDLFDNFKDVMPGDKLAETIQVQNSATDCDYIKLYMRAVVHDESGNPLTYSKVSENVEGKNQSNIDGQSNETVATMQDFLSQLTMRIYNGAQLIYEASPDQAGALADNVYLGTLFTGESLELTVELDVPIELDNTYANRVGEVDWIFLAEGFNYEQLTVHKVWDDHGFPARPGSVKVHLLRDGQVYEEVELSEKNQWTYTWDQLEELYTWSVAEAEVPQFYEVRYETSGTTTFIINYNQYFPAPEPEPTELHVRKQWAGDEKRLDKRPEAVSVTLYNGTREVDKVILNQENGWAYDWYELDGNGDWSVIETGIPGGYTPTYSTEGNQVTITNHATLIQTGQLHWPVWVLAGAGVVLMGFGLYTMIRKRKDENA
ncbi:MAG: Cna B-type domain-containing protein [Lachnospiraceae bacterium]|nr:Cna B-type domain-containing protein [Lachnospiraceae bacterium]